MVFKVFSWFHVFQVKHPQQCDVLLNHQDQCFAMFFRLVGHYMRLFLMVQQWVVCDVSSKSIHDDDDWDNNNDDFQIHQQYGHSVHQSCQSTMLNILKPKQHGTFYSPCYHTKCHQKNSLTRNGVDATCDHKSSQRSLFLQRQQWGQFTAITVNVCKRIVHLHLASSRVPQLTRTGASGLGNQATCQLLSPRDKSTITRRLEQRREPTSSFTFSSPLTFEPSSPLSRYTSRRIQILEPFSFI